MSDLETKERELRRRVTDMQDALKRLQAEAGALFQTSGWIRTDDELPPIGLVVLGTRFASLGRYTRKNDDGDWYHDYLNGQYVEGGNERPTFWMVIPPEPDT